MLLCALIEILLLLLTSLGDLATSLLTIRWLASSQLLLDVAATDHRQQGLAQGQLCSKGIEFMDQSRIGGGGDPEQ